MDLGQASHSAGCAVIRSVQIRAAGASPTVVTTEGRAETPPGHVRVRMQAAALNFADLLMIDGKYQENPSFPFVAGLEGSGIVIDAAPDVTALRPGSRVAVNVQGTLSDEIVVPADRCVAMPGAMSFNEAAGFLVAYGTSHLALTRSGALRSGERLVVLGAAGGVGMTAVEIGAALGAEVIGIARGPDRLAAVAAAGAAHTLDSDAVPDLKAALKALGGVDVVYDAVGGATGLAAFGALRPGGRHLLIGFAGGGPPQLPLNHALVKNIAIHGFYWGGWRTLDPDALQASLAELMALYEAGRLTPPVGAVLPLSRIDEAYALLRERRATGKVVIDMTDGRDELAHP